MPTPPRLNLTPTWIVLTIIVTALTASGHINQLAHYHDFADQSRWLGVPNGKDVWSNLGFVLAGAWAWSDLRRSRTPFARCFSLYLLAGTIMLTGLGSAYYHLQPNDFSLIWDRLPISLICAALLGMVFRLTHHRNENALLGMAILLAVGGVWHWHVSGDLRLYLGLQAFTILILPLWLWQSRAPRRITQALLWAIGCYVLSKIGEALDAAIFAATAHVISGHTLKHILATAAMCCVVVSICAVRQSD